MRTEGDPSGVAPSGRGADLAARLPDGLPVGLCRTTPDGRILEVNDTLVEMLGYADRAALLAVPAAQLYVDPVDREVTRVCTFTLSNSVSRHVPICSVNARSSSAVGLS